MLLAELRNIVLGVKAGCSRALKNWKMGKNIQIFMVWETNKLH